jgi:hypothetical protein
MNNYSLFRRQIIEATKIYPELKVTVLEGLELLEGIFRVIDDDGNEWNSFYIQIKFDIAFPYRFPELKEVGGKIPRIADWHINQIGDCCITIPLLEAVNCRNGITVLQFIDNHVKPYLFNQAYRIEKGYYAHQEFAHGVFGILEYYQELFDEKDTEKLMRYLNAIKSADLSKNTTCFCGKMAKFRKCHPAVYRIFKPLSEKFIEAEIEMIQAFLVSDKIS